MPAAQISRWENTHAPGPSHSHRAQRSPKLKLTDRPSDSDALSHRVVPRVSQPDTHVKQQATPERACINSFTADPHCHQPQQDGGAHRAGITWSRNMGEMKSWLWLGSLQSRLKGRWHSCRRTSAAPLVSLSQEYTKMQGCKHPWRRGIL